MTALKSQLSTAGLQPSAAGICHRFVFEICYFRNSLISSLFCYVIPNDCVQYRGQAHFVTGTVEADGRKATWSLCSFKQLQLRYKTIETVRMWIRKKIMNIRSADKTAKFSTELARKSVSVYSTKKQQSDHMFVL